VQRFRQRRPAPLENVDGEAAMPRLQLQAQHGRRSLTGAARRTQQKGGRVPGGGGELQAT